MKGIYGQMMNKLCYNVTNIQ